MLIIIVVFFLKRIIKLRSISKLTQSINNLLFIYNIWLPNIKPNTIQVKENKSFINLHTYTIAIPNHSNNMSNDTAK